MHRDLPLVSPSMTLLPLRAGPVTFMFDQATASIRDLRVGGVEVVRGIYGAVRDHNWGTVPPVLRDLQVETHDDACRVTFEADCVDGDVDFCWHGTIVGTPTGTVTFTFDGEARTSFLKNRIGLCVLHPIRECAGTPCRVEHVDGHVTSGAFPEAISPHQPFRDMRAISHLAAPGLHVRVECTGETFEMEDQRNWTDASFKTYSTPLDLPFPVRLQAGDRVRQVVRAEVVRDASLTPVTSSPVSIPRVDVDWTRVRPRPPVGLGTATCNGALSAVGQGRLAAVAPAHLRVDVVLAQTSWRHAFDAASRLASSLGAGLEVATVLSDDAERELMALRTHVEAGGHDVHRWLILHAAEKVTSYRWVRLAQRILDGAVPSAVLVAGTNAYFAELNRERPPADTPALPCFSITPQVHAFDDRSLVETLEAQRSTIESTQRFCASPVVVSPVTLRPRFNPNATDACGPAEPETDPRQSTSFAAAWTAGTLARLLASPHLHSLTCYETHGPRGIVAASGEPYPMAFVFEALRDWPLVGEACSSDVLLVDALALATPNGGRCLLLASLSAQPLRMRIDGIEGEACLRRLTPQGFSEPTDVRVSHGRVDLRVRGESVALLEYGALQLAADRPGGES